AESLTAASTDTPRVRSLSLDPGGSVRMGASLTVRGEVFSPDGRPPAVLVGIVRADGTPVYGVATDMERVTLRQASDDRFAFGLRLPELSILPGKYVVRAHALDPE